MHPARPDDRRGSTLVHALIALGVVVVLASALGAHAVSASRETQGLVEQARADAAAEAGVNEAWAVLETQGLAALQALTWPRTLRGGTCSVRVTDGDVDPGLDPGLVRLTAVGSAGDALGGAEVVLWRRPPTLGGGLFAKTKVHLETESKVDAYDSGDGTYASQAVNTYDAVAYADADVGVATNGNVETKTDSIVFGDVRLGPTGVYIDDGSGYVSGTISNSPAERVLPAIEVPVVASAGPLSLSGDGTTQTIGPGTFAYDQISVATKARLTIVGPATIVCSGSKTETEGKIFLDTSGGPIDFYCTGSFQVKTGTPWRTLNGSPVGVTAYLSAVGIAHKIETGAVFTGTIYAPDSEIVIQTTGDVFGAVIADKVTMKTKAFVHLDKALGPTSTGLPAWELVSVNRISGPAAQAAIDTAP